MRNLISVVSISLGLLVPRLATAHNDRRDEDRGFYDRSHKDYHRWDDHENRAWRLYLIERHHEYMDWQRAGERERQDYWIWRHEHSDAVLQIDINH